MFRSYYSRGLLFVAFLTVPAFAAAEIVITDAYARSSRPNAPTGAAFMMIENTSATADRLLSADSSIAKKVEVHTHVDKGDGVMQMIEIEEGIEIGAGGTHLMKRGGDHIMLMGLNETLEQGAEIAVTLTFEQAGDVEINIPVDNERKPAHGEGGHDHSSHNHSN
ncbi:MAG: copper chaperone PCu(A)C [Pseudomonadota bacterium]